MSRDHSMSLDPTPFTDHGPRLNDGPRANLYIGGKLGSGIDKGRWMDQRH
jgi:hypothetical protein